MRRRGHGRPRRSLWSTSAIWPGPIRRSWTPTSRASAIACWRYRRRQASGLAELARGHSTARQASWSGSQGSARSSLINRLVPGVAVSTSGLTRGSAEGRHTTTRVRDASHCPAVGRLIDAPGVRDFLPAIDDDRAVQVGFAEILAAAAQCRFTDCRHMREPGCAVKTAVDEAAISARRYESYRRLLRSTQSAPSR